MNTSYFGRASRTIPFNLKDYDGSVAVYYGVNENPHKTGFDALPGLPFDISLSCGYPVIQARVEEFGATGYRMFAGWIQVITSVTQDTQGHSKATVSVDLAPAFDGTGVPFAVHGFLPQLFDAPCLNRGDSAQLHWTADSFLTTVPVRSREEEISWLLGFRWGYSENDIPGNKPVLLPLQVTDEEAWNQHLHFLRQQYSSWRFKEA